MVGGMTTYEDLADATLRHGLMPLVVPQLKTITLGGAVTGLGIESTSLRNGMPHESVLAMDILTGDGRVVTATPGNEHADLFRGFPNSYGTLGYALSLTIELEPVTPFVHLRHFPFRDPAACMDAIAQIAADGSYQGHRADFLDGTMFSLDEMYLTVGAYSDVAPWQSDYTRGRIYYQSLRGPREDFLTIRDYLWRWDTDWFWCSRPFGVQNPVIRALWPRRYRRSDVYRRLVAFDRRYGLSDTLTARRQLPPREAVIQDVEIPVDRGAEFLRFFAADVGMSPVWLCPLRLRSDTGLAAVPAGARRGVRELRLLGHRAAAAGPRRRVPQPADRGRGGRARRAQGPVLDVVLHRGAVLGELQRAGVRRAQARRTTQTEGWPGCTRSACAGSEAEGKAETWRWPTCSSGSRDPTPRWSSRRTTGARQARRARRSGSPSGPRSPCPTWPRRRARSGWPGPTCPATWTSTATCTPRWPG